jgi:hypothetical protein
VDYFTKKIKMDEMVLGSIDRKARTDGIRSKNL